MSPGFSVLVCAQCRPCANPRSLSANLLVELAECVGGVFVAADRLHHDHQVLLLLSRQLYLVLPNLGTVLVLPFLRVQRVEVSFGHGFPLLFGLGGLAADYVARGEVFLALLVHVFDLNVQRLDRRS